jgi:excisionase family DNA binding protein
LADYYRRVPVAFRRTASFRPFNIFPNAFPMPKIPQKSVSENAEFIQIREAAEWLGVPFSSLREYVSRGLLPSYKLGRHRLFRKRVVLDALRQSTKASLDELLR